MKPRRSYDETGAARVKVPPAPFTEGLFAPIEEPTVPRWAETWGSLTDDERKAQRERWKELLLPIVLELAQRERPPGVTWSEVVAEGISRKILWGERLFLTNHPRVYSFGGGWLAQLAKQGKIAAKTIRVQDGASVSSVHLRREAERALSHSNDGFIYVRAA